MSPTCRPKDGTPGACASSTSRPTTGSARSRASSRRAQRRSKPSSAVLDVRLIRDQPDVVRRGLATKGGADLISELIALDGERRRLVRESEDLKALRNKASEAIGQAKRRGEDAAAEQARMREVGERIKALDDELKGVDAKIDGVLLQIPNLPDPSVP